MDDTDNSKDVISSIDSVEFKWDESNMSVGVIAQEIGTIDLSDYTISGNTGLNIGHAGISSASNWALSGSNGSTISYYDTLSAGTTEYGKTTIKTANNTIDIDELAEMMDTLKKRLLILAPNFEKHEKYPMLKQMYDEYKAMEALLSGPDSNE